MTTGHGGSGGAGRKQGEPDRWGRAGWLAGQKGMGRKLQVYMCVGGWGGGSGQKVWGGGPGLVEGVGGWVGVGRQGEGTKAVTY